MEHFDGYMDKHFDCHN